MLFVCGVIVLWLFHSDSLVWKAGVFVYDWFIVLYVYAWVHASVRGCVRVCEWMTLLTWCYKWMSQNVPNRFSTLVIIINVSWAANQLIRMISVWSCDNENSALITELNYILKYIQIKKDILNCNFITVF